MGERGGECRKLCILFVGDEPEESEEMEDLDERVRRVDILGNIKWNADHAAQDRQRSVWCVKERASR